MVKFAMKVSMERVMHTYVRTYVWGVMAHMSLECTFPFAELQSSPVTSRKCISNFSSFRITDSNCCKYCTYVQYVYCTGIISVIMQYYLFMINCSKLIIYNDMYIIAC